MVEKLPDQDEKTASEVDSLLKMPDQARIPITLIIAYTFAYEPNVFLSQSQSYASFKNQSNCWVYGQLPKSPVLLGLPW